MSRPTPTHGDDFQVEVVSLAGEVVAAVSAPHYWTVRDLKIAVHRKVNLPITYQVLLLDTQELKDWHKLSSVFKEAPSSIHADDSTDADEGPSDIIVVTLLRQSKSHVDWMKRWREVTPDWLVDEGSDRILTKADFQRLGLSQPPAPVASKVLEEDKPLPDKWDVQQIARELSRRRRRFPLDWENEAKGIVRLWPDGPVASRKDLVTALDTTLEISLLQPSLRYHDSCLRSVLTDAMALRPGMYHELPQHLQSMFRLDEALAADSALREEFLMTAGKSEINSWRWRVAEEEEWDAIAQRRKRKRGAKSKK